MINFKKQFPIIKKITYLDSASSQLKPLSVVNTIKKFYIKKVVNPYPADTPLSIKISKEIDIVRQSVAELVAAKKEEVIFTAGVTDGLNMIASMIKEKLKKDDEIIISKYNHDSNILPWLKLKKEIAIKVIVADDILKTITSKTRVISISQKTNNFVNNFDIQEIHKFIKNKNILLINDAAQAISWQPVSLKYCDVITFSGNKFYGPTGIGVIVLKQKLLKILKPTKVGSRVVVNVNDSYIFKRGVKAFEPGTPNTAGIIGLGAAIKFFNKTKKFITKTEKLSIYAYKKLSCISGLNIESKLGSTIIVFSFKNYSAQDIVSKLAHKYSIYVRGGSLCANLAIKNNNMVRVSLGIYNNKKDINKLAEALRSENFLFPF